MFAPGSLKFMRTKPSIRHSQWRRETCLVSARTGLGCEEFYHLLCKYYDGCTSTLLSLSEVEASVAGPGKCSVLQYKRSQQSIYWMWQQFTRQLIAILTHSYKHGVEPEFQGTSAGAGTEGGSGSGDAGGREFLSLKVSKRAKELEKLILLNEVSARTAGGILLKYALQCS